MCFDQADPSACPPHDTASASSTFFVRVEAFGSGAVIVPTFQADTRSTSVGALFACVSGHLVTARSDDDDEGVIDVRLLHGDQTISNADPHLLLVNLIDGEKTLGTTIVINAITGTRKQIETQCTPPFMFLSS